MIALVIALPGLALCAAIGWAIDHALARPFEALGPTRWVLRVLMGLVAAVAFLLHPLVAASLAAVHFGVYRASLVTPAPATVHAPVHATTRASASATSPRTQQPSRTPRHVLALLGAGCLAIAWRPAAPLYWDEPIWLAKVRLGPLALREAALDPAGPLVPRGYPILASLAQSLFAAGREELWALVVGPAALAALALAVVLTLLPTRRALPWSLALLTMPLVWVHLRSAHLDLTVGLLALGLWLALDRARGDVRALHVAAPIACLLAGTKDEGLAHVLAVGLGHALSAPHRRSLRDLAAPLLAALTASGGFRLLLWQHGVGNDDHALRLAGLPHAPEILLELTRAATDVASFGLAWPLALGTSIAACVRHAPDTRALAFVLGAQLATLSAGLLAGSERLLAFTLDGTVAARLLVQLAPVAACLVVAGLSELPRGAGAAPSTRAQRT